MGLPYMYMHSYLVGLDDYLIYFNNLPDCLLVSYAISSI